MKLLYLSLFLASILTSCAVPDDYVGTSPMVNNPNVINQRSGSSMPGMNM